MLDSAVRSPSLSLSRSPSVRLASFRSVVQLQALHTGSSRPERLSLTHTHSHILTHTHSHTPIHPHAKQVLCAAYKSQPSWNILLTVRRPPKRQKIYNKYRIYVRYSYWVLPFANVGRANGRGRQRRRVRAWDWGLGTTAGSAHVSGMIYIGKLRFQFAFISQCWEQCSLRLIYIQ